MTTSNNIDFTLPDFDLGTQPQISLANDIRRVYIETLVDRGFDPKDIQLFISVRPVAKWWLDNRSKLSVMNFTKHLSAAKGLVTRHGSVAEVGIAQIAAYKKKIQDSENYRKLSQPMYKFSG